MSPLLVTTNLRDSGYTHSHHHWQLRETYENTDSQFKVVLSIIAADNVYCIPRESLPSLFDYTHVECALLNFTPAQEYTCVHPYTVGIRSRRIASFFDTPYSQMRRHSLMTTVAPYLSWAQVNDLRHALQHAAENH